MLAERKLEAEILDCLPAADPRAVRARRDLKRINAIMLQTRIMMRLLSWCCRGTAPRLLIELGGGDGTFIVSLAWRLAQKWPGLTVVSVDRQASVAPEVVESVRNFGWRLEPVKADVFDFFAQGGTGSRGVVIANLFLHHLPAEALHSLFAAAQPHAEAFAACEPHRGAFALLSSELVWAIGCGEVARHDAVASVRAGFRDHEISTSFPMNERWDLLECGAFPFTHCFAARRTLGQQS